VNYFEVSLGGFPPSMFFSFIDSFALCLCGIGMDVGVYWTSLKLFLLFVYYFIANKIIICKNED